MRRILIVTQTLPFPPRNGKELPIAHLISGFAERFECDMAVLSRDPAEFDRRLPYVPDTVRNVWQIDTHERSRLARLVEELTLRTPAFVETRFDGEDLERLQKATPYDALWVSPIGGIGFVDWCQEQGIFIGSTLCIGLNDVKSTLYLDCARELRAGSSAWTFERLGRLARVPLLYLHERKILRRADVVHVQTELEATRARKVLGPGARVRIVAAQNGRKDSLFETGYKGRDSKRILFMTHLAGGRSWESKWFLDEVWPQIRRGEPEATLLLVGTPPEPRSDVLESLPAGVEVLGYADDLVRLYDSVALSVVPIFHSTGIINRVVDALCAGVPIVARSDPLRTVPGLIPGRHALAADQAEPFAQAVISLLQDPAARNRMSSKGRDLAWTQPRWVDTVGRISDVVGQVVDGGVDPHTE